MALSPDEKQVAAGHSDGTIRLWDYDSAEAEPPASGHKTGVSALTYSQRGALLASGGMDTDAVVWDVSSGSPLYRLQGHLGQVTALVIFSCSHSKLQSIPKQALPLLTCRFREKLVFGTFTISASSSRIFFLMIKPRVLVSSFCYTGFP